MAADAAPSTDPVIPSELPVIPVRSSVVFPMSVHPLVIANPVAIDSVNRALAADRQVALVFQDGENDEAPAEELARIGTAGIIRQMARAPVGLQVLVEGVLRIRLDEFTRDGRQLTARVSPAPDVQTTSLEIDAYVRRLREMVDRAFSLSTGLPQELRVILSQIDDPLRLCYLLASLIEMKPRDKQLLLEQDDVAVKLQAVASALGREIELLEIKGRIESKAQEEMSDTQRQYFLRQQLKAIQSELGESEGQELQDLRARIDTANLPEPVLKAVTRELDRLERMTPASPEGQMVRTYIEWVLDVPWSKVTEDRLNPAEARNVLDTDHYDLDKVKERIVEYLAVRKLKGDMKGPILCFVGPPGVGKTSLGQSIARAMNRQFVRISLGGVRDEAEIRGHRRTYIGSMPGRIVQALKQAGSANPVFMLDEIDKMSVGFQGDPAAALLEVLDPAQNHSFRDHYLEVPFDLSRVLFIATANQLGPVHPALLDRMEVISLSGYTEEEKVHIARRYLIPRQLAEHGLPDAAVELTDRAVRRVITEYTREAGVRSLERQLGAIARKVAARLAGALPATPPAAATPPSDATTPPAAVGGPALPVTSAGEEAPAAGETATSVAIPITSAAEGASGGAGAGLGAGLGPGLGADRGSGLSGSSVPTTVIDADSLVPYLGQPRFRKDVAFRTSRPGVATGVAWTEAGGDVLFIEATVLPGGSGQIVLTGQLGNVMQESARAAVSHIRANAGTLGVSPGFLEHHDLHVHVPAGAIPKDGPSAGVTMATAILSALRREAVREDVAMTGEITLSGLVLPVGGIREKALAARRFGVRTFVLPAENRYDLEDLPDELKHDMTFVPVATLEEVLKVALPAMLPAAVDVP